jgi:hypothetical protein
MPGLRGEERDRRADHERGGDERPAGGKTSSSEPKPLDENHREDRGEHQPRSGRRPVRREILVGDVAALPAERRAREHRGRLQQRRSAVRREPLEEAGEIPREQPLRGGEGLELVVVERVGAQAGHHNDRGTDQRAGKGGEVDRDAALRGELWSATRAKEEESAGHGPGNSEGDGHRPSPSATRVRGLVRLGEALDQLPVPPLAVQASAPVAEDPAA